MMFYKVNYQKYLTHYLLIHEIQINQDHQQIRNQIKLQLMKYISQSCLFIKIIFLYYDIFIKLDFIQLLCQL